LADGKIGEGSLVYFAAKAAGKTTKEIYREAAEAAEKELGIPPRGSEYIPRLQLDADPTPVRPGLDADPNVVQWNPVNAQKLPIPGYSNALLFLRHHLSGRVLRNNEMTDQLEFDGTPIDDTMISTLIANLEMTSGVGRWSRDCITASVARLAAESPKYHPVRAYLKGLAWDGVPRINQLVGGAIVPSAESEIFPVYIAKFFLSAVARAMSPGVKSDLVLILQGGQGIRKSTFFASLVPNRSWFDDASHNVDDKDASLSVSRAWIMEWSELESVKRSTKGAVKAFLTRQVDRYRPPYGRTIVERPRAAVIVGSTNEDQFLADETGNRRFMILPVKSIDIDAIIRDRDELWAEAVFRYMGGEPHWLESDDMVQAQAERNAVAEHGDPWEDMIQGWIESGEGMTREEGVGVYTTVRDVSINCLQLASYQINKATEMRIAACLKSLGCKRTEDKILTRQGAIRVYHKPGELLVR
jgi:predicted P-loop ATPase